MLRFALRWWASFVVPVAALIVTLSLGPTGADAWGDAQSGFVIVLVLAASCAVGAVLVVAVGAVRRLPEVALLGGVAWAVSLMGMIHGLLLPGGPYGANPGSQVAVMLAVPVALAAGLPVLLDGRRSGLWLAVRCRAWVTVSLLVPAALGAALLLQPRLLPAPSVGGPIAIAIVAVSLAGTGALSLRHLRLYAIGRRGGSLLASIGFISPGLATIAFLGAAPLSPGWWIAHLTDALGVLFVAAGLLWAHWRDRSLAIVLSPVLTREPLTALELGLTPVVHRFIAALEAKDEVTRLHVIRVSELAIRIGERAGLDAVSLRAVGLGGLLHDVGKLLTPDRILVKPGALTDEERAVIERHPLDGEALISPYPHLAEVASIVRWHHERPDGRGYPDRLAGAEIPITASIVSVADAFDAMVSDRPYRDGMPTARAQEILAGGSGTQWQPRAVEALLAELHDRGLLALSRSRHMPRIVPSAAPSETEDDLLAACMPVAVPLSQAG